MKTKVAINGFGRIGRLVLRAIYESRKMDLDVVAINDLATTETNAFLLKHDSIHGIFPEKIEVDKNLLKIGKSNIRVINEKDPGKLPWKDLNVDIVLECTGFFASKEKASSHVLAGAKKVLVSAPCSNADKTIVFGINENTLSKQDIIISNASCTTNCLAPVAHVLHKKFSIQSGYMTTIHAFTGDQRVLDTAHADLKRARAASMSLIPTSTGAAKAIGLVIPELKGKLDGTAIRVPTPNVSLVDLTFVTEKDITPESINEEIIKASNGKLKGILCISDLPLVSIDFNHNPASSTFDLNQTQVLGEKFGRILSWYDNEWGFSNRMCDTATAISKLL
jgi:glyceraldehyde 3-phosphate dehydrogenase